MGLSKNGARMSTSSGTTYHDRCESQPLIDLKNRIKYPSCSSSSLLTGTGLCHFVGNTNACSIAAELCIYNTAKVRSRARLAWNIGDLLDMLCRAHQRVYKIYCYACSFIARLLHWAESYAEWCLPTAHPKDVEGSSITTSYLLANLGSLIKNLENLGMYKSYREGQKGISPSQR